MTLLLRVLGNILESLLKGILGSIIKGVSESICRDILGSILRADLGANRQVDWEYKVKCIQVCNLDYTLEHAKKCIWQLDFELIVYNTLSSTYYCMCIEVV